MRKIISKILKNRDLLSLFLAIIVFCIIFIFSLTNIFYGFNKKIQDLYYLFSDNNISRNLLVVEIDEETLSWRKDNFWEITYEWLWRFPFDRKYYAKVIDNLTDAWALTIWLDVVFWEKSNIESDKILSDSIKKSKNIVLWLWRNSSWYIEYPYEKFSDYTKASWYYAPSVDKVTNIVYSIVPYSEIKNRDNTSSIYEHFSISILRLYYSKLYNNDNFLTSKILEKEDKIIINEKIELLKSRINNKEVLINYSDAKKFNKESFLDIYNNNFDKNKVKDKIVLIWATAKWIKDVFNTPLWVEYWVYTHANMINTVITKNMIKYLDKNMEWLIIFLFIIISVYFNISKSSYVLIFSNISIIALIIISILFITVFTNILLNYPFELFFAIIFSLILSNIVKYIIENKSKKKLNRALSEYVSEDVAKEILSWEWVINLDWENKKISIFFSDIEWFTTISEKFSPEQLVWFLREYLSDMSDIILDNKGFINKYEWDAIMALWWTFWNDDKKTYNSCISAINQQKLLKQLNVNWMKSWLPEIKARIWIHFWNAIIWNIGSKWRKMEFTALWDSVNLASRLEWVNKFYWTYICVSEDVYEEEKDNFEFRYLDRIKVKWKDNAIKIYELLWVKWELEESILENKDLFEQAVSVYLTRDFKKAKNLFEKLIKNGDKPSNTYLDMCELYIKNSPSDDWEWISVMDSK